MHVTVLGMILVPAQPGLGRQPGAPAAARFGLGGVRGRRGPGAGRQFSACRRPWSRGCCSLPTLSPSTGWACATRRRGPVLATMVPLFGLLGYALLSVMILPQMFEGKVMVWAAAAGSAESKLRAAGLQFRQCHAAHVPDDERHRRHLHGAAGDAGRHLVPQHHARLSAGRLFRGRHRVLAVRQPHRRRSVSVRRAVLEPELGDRQAGDRLGAANPGAVLGTGRACFLPVRTLLHAACG